MSQKPNISGLGIGFESPITGYENVITSVVGVPDGTGALADYELGSKVVNESTGYHYIKLADNGNAADWVRLATKSEVDALSSGISWREPALAADLSATSLPTGTATQTIDVDGVTIDDGGRALFAAVTGNKNVFLYDKASGLFVEDSSLETSGDAVYVIGGTSGGKTFVYNGSAWVLNGQSSLDEEGYIRAFVGKTGAGSELPTYTSTTVIANNDSLKAALDKLDAFADKGRHEFSASAVTTATTVDSVLVGDVRRVIWEVDIAKADQTAFKTVTVNAIHNGKTSADATAVDFATTDILKVGTIAGLQFDVVLAGAATAQTMGLTVVSTPSVNVKGIRRVIAV